MVDYKTLKVGCQQFCWVIWDNKKTSVGHFLPDHTGEDFQQRSATDS